MPTRRTGPLRAVLIAVLVSAVVTPVAHAGGGQLSMMMDDNNLVYRSPRTTDRTLDAMKSLGVDYVRVTVLWKVVAEGARRTRRLDKRFRHLKADNPRAYPKRNWDRYDQLVRSAASRGIGVYFNLTGPGPKWCCPKPPASERANAETWMPDARQFKLFVRAVGRRYSGKYRDENVRGRARRLPRVSFWSLWNEPNQGGWLTPQWWKGRAYSPMLYRNLYIAGRQGLVGTGHASDTILIGETAPNGASNHTRSRSAMYPTTFIKTLFCTDGNGNRRSGLGCDVFDANGPLLATAWGHHPYTKDRSPLTPDPSSQAITLANLGTLTTLLDAIAAKTGRIAADLPVALTEFGYETRPPDPFNGISLGQQADYTALASLVAWANPRVISETQFLLRDVAPLRRYTKNSRPYWFTYQSGLFFNKGRAKPAATAYAFPLLGQPAGKDDAGRTVYGLWGQARFRPNDRQDYIYFQFRAKGTRNWVNFGDPAVTQLRRNFYLARVVSPGAGKVRAVWLGADAPKVFISRSISIVA